MSTNVETALPVSGMSCAVCVAKIEKVLRNTEGVTAASVHVAAGRACVEYDPNRVGLTDLASAIEGLGFAVPRDRMELLVLHRERRRDCRGYSPVTRVSARNSEHGVLTSIATGGAV